MADIVKWFHAKSPAEWRAWLETNHAKESLVLLVRHKKHTGEPTFTNSDAMDEAICFGWIDTTLKRIDDDRFGIRYVRRGMSSRWSHNTVARARRLIKEGRMAPAGLAAFKAGLRKPLHERFPKDPPLPDDLRRALEKSKRATAFFDTLAPSYRRSYILLAERAKRPATRKRRIRLVVERCREAKKPMA